MLALAQRQAHVRGRAARDADDVAHAVQVHEVLCLRRI
jgi:hypothetical protein